MELTRKVKTMQALLELCDYIQGEIFKYNMKIFYPNLDELHTSFYDKDNPKDALEKVHTFVIELLHLADKGYI